MQLSKLQGLLLLSLILLAGCGPSRNLVYFSDLQGSAEYKAPVQHRTEPKIQPDDLLGITVSSLNPESNAIFNNMMVPASGNGSVMPVGNPARTHEGYLVDKAGMINFPVMGKICLNGLTRGEATEKMAAELTNHVKSPIVNIRFLNFKVTVIGEVNRPSSFTIPTEKINVLEALGLAGDMTPFGKRENVLIIREKDGVQSATRLNLNNKDILTSPYFYLQQNDIVYVEPENKAKAAQTNPNNRFIPIFVATITGLAVLAAALLR